MKSPIVNFPGLFWAEIRNKQPSKRTFTIVRRQVCLEAGATKILGYVQNCVDGIDIS